MLSYMSQLSKASRELFNYTEVLKNNPDKEIISWIAFLEWFSGKFEASISNEQERIQSEELEALADKASALTTLGVVGGALVAFMLFTMMLALLRIEINTRKDEDNQAETDK